MEHWHSIQTFSEHCGRRPQGRVLTDICGNARQYPPQGKPDLTKHEPYQSVNPGFSDVLAQGHPLPTATLGSNDYRAVARRKLIQNSIQQRMNIPKPWLSHPSYITYRNRRRKDIGKDGSIIWTDAAENAFQNAVLYIPAMGKNKRSQHGKPHGRNELIAEWILHETKGQSRVRKQVSSHIQVLDKMFKDIPEWRALNKKSPELALFNQDTHYYSDSIADMVAEVLRLQAGGEQQGRPAHSSSTRHHLWSLEFEMWVGMPQNIDEALHRYTSLRQSPSLNMPIGLEDIPEWRSDFPDLLPILEAMLTTDELDIVIVDASLLLMDHFPPESSKLGISLGLSFVNADSQLLAGDAGCQSWSCITKMYRQGKIFRTTQEDRCSVSGSSIVKPRFESKWWAHEFTWMTDLRQGAQTPDEDDFDDDDDARVKKAEAEAFASKHFGDLTIMQQISNGPDRSDDSQCVWIDGNALHRRVTILLWKFSSTPAGADGIATWQKLVPPSRCLTVNIPEPISNQPPPPPMLLESALRTDPHQVYYEGHNGYPDTQFAVNESYTPDLDEELCQDGYMMVNHSESCIDENMSSVLVTGHNYHGSTSFEMDSQYEFVVPAHQFDGYGRIAQTHTDVQDKPELYEEIDTNLYQLHEEAQGENRLQRDDRLRGERQYALESFDSATHELLQEQLRCTQPGDEGEDLVLQPVQVNECLHDEHSENSTGLSRPLESMTVAATVADEAQVLDKIEMPSVQLDGIDNQQTVALAPVAIRPLFQQQHSFASVFPAGPNLEVDAPRPEFTRILENMEAHHEAFFGVNNMVGLEAPTAMARSYSQPPGTASIGLVGDKACSEADSAEDWVEIEMAGAEQS